MSLTLTPLNQNELPRVEHLRVAPDQVRFAGTVAEAFVANEPNVDFHSVNLNDRIIGFFKIDHTHFERYYFADEASIGLRAFIIDLNQQGQGCGTAACRALPIHQNTHYPNAAKLYLTVNVINLPAIRSYKRGGVCRHWSHLASWRRRVPTRLPTSLCKINSPRRAGLQIGQPSL